MASVIANPAALQLVLHSWADWWRPLLLGGLLPLALLGAFSTPARAFLYGSGYLALLFLLLPWPGGLPWGGPVVRFFAADVPRC